MEALQEVQLEVMDEQVNESNSADSGRKKLQTRRNYSWWIRITVYIVFVLCGQSAALVLGRLYFTKGGHSKWMATLVQIIGFPILIPYYLRLKLKDVTQNHTTPNSKAPSSLILATVYVSVGLIQGAVCFLYSTGMQYLPVSTYTLISASQLGFNAFFAYFLNSQKFTPFIVNSLFLLTTSSLLLVFSNESSDPTSVSKLKYAIGFACTLAASAGYGFLFSLTQLFFRKVIKKQTFTVVMEMIIYPSAIATVMAVTGLFASGEWIKLTNEMENYELGKISYLMNVIWTSIIWQVFMIGCLSLVSEVSSLFSNSIGVVGLPIVPVISIFVFHDKMDGIKVISMVLAAWGFISYAYQHYVDDRKSKVGSRDDDDDDDDDEVSKVRTFRSCGET